MSNSKDKTAGILTPVTSLRHAGDLGIGANLDDKFLNGELVDYEQAKKLKRKILADGSTRFKGNDDFDAFGEAEKRGTSGASTPEMLNKHTLGSPSSRLPPLPLLSAVGCFQPMASA
ncbi:MAG: hypothetical protein ACN4GG_07745 [Akkermansiaceae bacterium]